MTGTTGPTRELAEFVAGVRSQTLPDAVVIKTAEIIQDTLGCGLAAWRDDGAAAPWKMLSQA